MSNRAKTLLEGWKDLQKWLGKKFKAKEAEDEEEYNDMNNSLTKAGQFLKMTEDLSPSTDSTWEDFERWAKLNIHSRELEGWLKRAKKAYDEGDDDTIADLLDELKG